LEKGGIDNELSVGMVTDVRADYRNGRSWDAVAVVVACHDASVPRGRKRRQIRQLQSDVQYGLA